MDTRKLSSWLERVEALVSALEGSTISELELTEAGTEIIIRRLPGMVLTSMPRQTGTGPLNVQMGSSGQEQREGRGVALVAPLTGVYYSAASPTSSPFVAVGDIVQVGQLVALIEAMKVFNEIQAQVAGRVVAIVAENGQVVQKGEVLLRIEPV
jgi:acetyl-CoA carboxylase biotin carboxyl carrier protein